MWKKMMSEKGRGNKLMACWKDNEYPWSGRRLVLGSRQAEPVALWNAWTVALVKKVFHQAMSGLSKEGPGVRDETDKVGILRWCQAVMFHLRGTLSNHLGSGSCRVGLSYGKLLLLTKTCIQIEFCQTIKLSYGNPWKVDFYVFLNYKE